MLYGQVGHTGFFVRVFAIFIDGPQQGAGIGQVDTAVVFHCDIGIRYLAHAVKDVNACVAA